MILRASATPPGYSVLLAAALIVVAVVSLLMVWFPGAAIIWGTFYGVHRARGGAKSGVRAFRPRGMLVVQALWGLMMIGAIITGIVEMATGNFD